MARSMGMMQAGTDEFAIWKSSALSHWMRWCAGLGLTGQVCVILYNHDMSVSALLDDGHQMACGVVGSSSLAASIFLWIMSRPLIPEPSKEAMFPLRGRWLKLGYAGLLAGFIPAVVECVILVGSMSAVFWF